MHFASNYSTLQTRMQMGVSSLILSSTRKFRDRCGGASEAGVLCETRLGFPLGDCTKLLKNLLCSRLFSQKGKAGAAGHGRNNADIPSVNGDGMGVVGESVGRNRDEDPGHEAGAGESVPSRRGWS